MTTYELLGYTSGAKSQNEEWLSPDIKVHDRPKKCTFDIAMSSNVAVEITFDSGSNWVDLAKSNQLELKDEIRLMIHPDELVNLRTTNGSGTTVQRCRVYSAN